MSFVEVQSHRIEYELLNGAPPGRPTMVFLHEGLGSVAMWKDFPRECARAAGCQALVYSRYGYGQSDPITAPRAVDYLHDEALKALPELLDKLDVEQPILFGHSDGASISLIHGGGMTRPVRGIIAMAPHTMVEDIAIQGLEEIKRAYETTDLRARLARYHADPDSAFRGWNDIWLNSAFRTWNIEAYLPQITCPVLAIQGEDDHYGTMEHIDQIERAVPNTDVLELKECGHSPHRDQPERVIERVTQFVERLTK